MIDFDANFEEQQDDADVRQHLKLVAIGDVARSEGRDDQAGAEISEHGRQTQTARHRTGSDGEQEHHPDLEHRRGAFERSRGGKQHGQMMKGRRVPTRGRADAR